MSPISNADRPKQIEKKAGSVRTLRPGGGGAAGFGGLLVHRDDHLVGADEAELAMDHLLGEVGIGMVGVEQLRAVGEPRPLVLELGEPGALDRPGAAIIAPGEDSVLADDG